MGDDCGVMRKMKMIFQRAMSAVVMAVLVAGCATGGKTAAPVARKSKDNNPLRNPPGIVDRLVMLDTPETLGQGTRKCVNLVMGPPALLVLLDPANREYPRRGMWE